MKRDYRQHIKHGPGGIGCPCCNAYNCHPRRMKARSRRLVRRKAKQDVQREAKEVSWRG